MSNILQITKDKLSNAELADIKGRFIYPNPKFFENIRLGFSNFGVSPTLCLVEETDSNLLLPRGLISPIFAAYPAVEIIDETVINPIKFPPSKIVLKDFQVPAVDALMEKNQGILCSGTGSGKSIVGIEVILRRGQKALVVVGSLDLLTQWVSYFKKFADIEAGVIQSGKWEINRPVVVATYQSLNRPLTMDTVNQFGLIFADETHHVAAPVIQQVIGQFPSRFRYGASATVERRDGLTFLVHATMGSVVYKVEKNDLFVGGHIIKPSVKGIQTNYYDPSIESYQDLISRITKDTKRNELILSCVFKEAKERNYCLVLSERIAHANELYEQFLHSYPEVNSVCITGQNSKDHRKLAIDGMNQGEINVLFSTQIANEGLDLPRLNRIFLTCPIRSHTKIIQQTGRALRPFPEKRNAVIYDFIDSLCSLALSQWKTRKYKAYSGYEIEEIPYQEAINE